MSPSESYMTRDLPAFQFSLNLEAMKIDANGVRDRGSSANQELRCEIVLISEREEHPRGLEGVTRGKLQYDRLYPDQGTLT
jgi:hypothetical protein